LVAERFVFFMKKNCKIFWRYQKWRYWYE